MTERTKPPRPERHDTDGSLREERTKTDDELASRRAMVEQHADAVIESAQDRADSILAIARAEADRKLQQTAPPTAQLSAIAQERSVEDRALDEERSTASERLGRERAEGAELLAELLRFERIQTDSHLGVERDQADAAIASYDEFLGMVSHDLRTLLGGVALSAAMILRHAGDDPLQARYRAEGLRTQRYVARMNRLLGDLLDIVSIEAGKLRIAPEPADAASLVREAAESFQPLAAASGITLTTEVSEDALRARFDHDRMIQVLANLISNAIKFTKSGGSLEVRVSRAGDEVEFSVRDSGSGIPGDKLPSIFERFAQVRDDRRGLGLGLYISRCIVEAHGGRLSVESTLGEGSTFTVTLPA